MSCADGRREAPAFHSKFNIQNSKLGRAAAPLTHPEAWCYIVLQPPPISMTTLTIRIPEQLKAELDAASRSEDRPNSDIVRESIRRYLALSRFRAIRRQILPFAEAQGLLTDEDVFRELQ